jgi:ABC-type branched-chain amino acid transport systems, periplasmic component
VRPDAVLIGGSGTQGALPLLALGERGFKGKTYGTVALVNPDFVRVGGKAAEGIQVSAGRSSWPSSFPTTISPRSSRSSSAPPS